MQAYVTKTPGEKKGTFHSSEYINDFGAILCTGKGTAIPMDN